MNLDKENDYDRPMRLQDLEENKIEREDVSRVFEQSEIFIDQTENVSQMDDLRNDLAMIEEGEENKVQKDLVALSQNLQKRQMPKNVLKHNIKAPNAGAIQ